MSLDDVMVMLLKGCGEIYSKNQSLGTIEAVGLYGNCLRIYNNISPTKKFLEILLTRFVYFSSTK